MVRRYRNGWWLHEKYVEEGWTQREIAEECGVSATTIREYMQRFDVPTRDVEGEAHGLYDRERDPAVREKISESLAGREMDAAWRDRIGRANSERDVSEATRERITESLSGLTRSPETRRKMSESTAGPSNPNWRGGYSDRYGAGWSLARERVRRRDGCCQECGHDGSEFQLAVHHIVPVRAFRDHPSVPLEEAHADENLVLLCNRCHARADHGELDFEPPPELVELLNLDGP